MNVIAKSVAGTRIVEDPAIVAIEDYNCAVDECERAEQALAEAERLLPPKDRHAICSGGPQITNGRQTFDSVAQINAHYDNERDEFKRLHGYALRDEVIEYHLAGIERARAEVLKLFIPEAERLDAIRAAIPSYDIAVARERAAYKAEETALRRASSAVPTTTAGTQALIAFVRDHLLGKSLNEVELAEKALTTLSKTEVSPPPAAPAAARHGALASLNQ